MVIACKGIDILKRVLCLLLCVVLLFCFFMVPRAGAVALEATTIAYGGLLVGTILVGAGVVFSSHGDMVKVGNAMYKTLVNGSSAIGKTISSISAWAVEHGTSLAKGALRVGKDLYQGIVDAFNASYSGGTFFIGENWADFSRFVATASTASTFYAYLPGASHSWYIGAGTPNRWYRFDVVHTDSLFSVECYYYSDDWRKLDTCSSGGGSTIVSWVWALNDYDLVCRATYVDGHTHDFKALSLEATVGYIGTVFPDRVAVPTPDLSYPSDNTLVRMPDIPSVDTDTGEAVFPADAAYTKDAVSVPYPTDADGVKVPDIPYDKIVDQSTGKALDDTGTDTDNPSKPGEGMDTDNPSWPDTGSLSLPKLIASKFPFCIPFDVARLVGLLEAEPKAPVFRIPVVYANIVNEEIVIDFDKFADVLQIIRWGEIMLFVAGLVVITRNYIKW